MSSTWIGASGPVPRSLLRVRTGPTCAFRRYRRSRLVTTNDDSKPCGQQVFGGGFGQQGNHRPLKRAGGIAEIGRDLDLHDALRGIDHLDAGLVAQRPGQRRRDPGRSPGSPRAARSASADRRAGGGFW